MPCRVHQQTQQGVHMHPNAAVSDLPQQEEYNDRYRLLVTYPNRRSIMIVSLRPQERDAKSFPTPSPNIRLMLKGNDDMVEADRSKSGASLSVKSIRLMAQPRLKTPEFLHSVWAI
ncbi:hypothetical protein BaRGS_00004969 [Batillaria attramentaria]|uniref:Uncharacterized protein n=1 Tax=Batillaria attramentaria TaxID=370345 RepID=A0ABD0LWE9_9CAEN